jgi:hypothetical protein
MLELIAVTVVALGAAGAPVLPAHPAAAPAAVRAPAFPSRPDRTMIPPAGVEVPMLESDHMPAVHVMVNGQGPFLFAIDTGAAGTLRLDSTLVERLGLKPVGEIQASDGSGRNVRTMALVAVDSLQIGEARFVGGLQAAVRNYNERALAGKIDGILGFGLFSDALLRLDYPGKKVAVLPGSLPEANGDDVLDYRVDRGIPEIDLVVAGVRVPSHVDAGSMGGFGLPDTLIARLPLASEPRVIGRGRTVSNSFEIRAAELKGDVVFGGFRYPNATVAFQPVMPMGNVGSRILRDFRITFDQKHRRMKLEKTAATP